MKIFRILFLSLLVVLPFFSFADFSLSDWQYKYKIDFPVLGGSGTSSYFYFDITEKLFANLNEDLSDLRIISGDKEIPYVVLLKQQRSQSVKIPVKILNLSTVPGKETSFVLDLGSNMIHNTVYVDVYSDTDTSSKSYLKKVSVYGSDDQSTWRTLNDDGKIFGYFESGARILGNYIKYPDSTFKYLMVKVYEDKDPSLKISGASVSREFISHGIDLKYKTSFASKEEKNETDLIVSLDASGIPHHEAIIETLDENFYREVYVFESNDGLSWKQIGLDYVYNINTPKFKDKDFAIKYPESRAKYIKFSIKNKDDDPISISNVFLSGVVRRVVFELVSGGDYFIYTGNTNAKKPSYDLSLTLKSVEDADITQVVVGDSNINDSFIQPKLPLTERSPYVLVAFLALVVLFLILFLIFVFKRG